LALPRVDTSWLQEVALGAAALRRCGAAALRRCGAAVLRCPAVFVVPGGVRGVPVVLGRMPAARMLRLATSVAAVDSRGNGVAVVPEGEEVRAGGVDTGRGAK
jgi:hypothetical protein